MTSLIKLRGLVRITNTRPGKLFEVTSQGRLQLFDQVRCAGHAKWQNIKGTKEANDIAKSQRISKAVQMIRRVIVANGYQTDPKLNTKLAAVLAEAAKNNVPKATIERAIERTKNLRIDSVLFEVEGPSRSAVIIRGETENVHELRGAIKKILRKHEAAFVPASSITNMFKSQGLIKVATTTKDGRPISSDFAEEVAIMSDAKEAYLEVDEETEEEVWNFSVDADIMQACRGELEKHGLEVISCNLNMVPYNKVAYPEEDYKKITGLQKALSAQDQVVDVFHNATLAS